MTTILNRRYCKTTQPYVRYTRTEADRLRDSIPDRRDVTQKVTEEEEAAMVAKYAFILALLGITPLLVFVFIHFFVPDLLVFLDAPVK